MEDQNVPCHAPPCGRTVALARFTMSNSRTAPIKKGSFRDRRKSVPGGPLSAAVMEARHLLVFVERYLGACRKNILFLRPPERPFFARVCALTGVSNDESD